MRAMLCHTEQIRLLVRRLPPRGVLDNVYTKQCLIRNVLVKTIMTVGVGKEQRCSGGGVVGRGSMRCRLLCSEIFHFAEKGATLEYPVGGGH